MSRDSERSSSSSEEEDEDAKELTEDIEKNFLRTLSCLRKRDPKIYDSNVKFFEDKPDESSSSEPKENKKKKKKKESLSVRQYEKKLLLERGPEFIEEEDVADIQEPTSPTYIEEQKALKENFKKILESSDSDDSESLFKVKEKPAKEKEKEEESFKKWLKGQEADLKDDETKQDLQYLHDCWTDPNIDKTEEYLKDYILNKRYLESDDMPSKITPLEDFSDDEEEIKRADEFEHKYNFRFEEPDREFLKRYPRDIESSLRRKDAKQEKRKLARERAKERKLQKIQEKQKEVGILKKAKREELLQQIQKLKDITGNDKLAFEDELLNEDFDSNKFDQKMEEVFSNEFYGGEDVEKPVFEDDDFDYGYYENQEVDPEDPNFVMDCDYDPQTAKQKKLEKKLKSKDKKKNKLTSSDPNDLPDEVKSNAEAFEKYFDEYYKYDFEDLIDDIPCRFKYRKCVPNSFGLTIDEILAADDDELEKWCSIKKVDMVRPEHAEKNEANIYAQKARDEALKRKILPSLYKYKDADDFDSKPEDEKKKKKKKKKKKNKAVAEASDPEKSHEEAAVESSAENLNPYSEDAERDSHSASSADEALEAKAKGRRKKETASEEVRESEMGTDSNAESHMPSKSKKKKKRQRSEMEEELSHDLGSKEVAPELSVSPKKKKKNVESAEIPITSLGSSATNLLDTGNQSKKKKKKLAVIEACDTEKRTESQKNPSNNHKRFSSGKKNNDKFNGSKNVKNSFPSEQNNKRFSFGKKNNDKFNRGGPQSFSPGSNSKYSNDKRNFNKNQNWNSKHSFKNRDRNNTNSNFKPWQKSKLEASDKLGLSDARLEAYGINPKKYKNKLIYSSNNTQ